MPFARFQLRENVCLNRVKENRNEEDKACLIDSSKPELAALKDPANGREYEGDPAVSDTDDRMNGKALLWTYKSSWQLSREDSEHSFGPVEFEVLVHMSRRTI